MENKETLEKKTENSQEPSFLNVVKEMKVDINQSAHSLFKNIVTSAPIRFGAKFAKTFYGVAITPYIIPTAVVNPNFIVRKEGNKYVAEDDGAGLFGFALGIGAGIGADIAQYVALGAAVFHNHYEILAIPVVTNCASGIYEWYKDKKQQMREMNR